MFKQKKLITIGLTLIFMLFTANVSFANEVSSSELKLNQEYTFELIGETYLKVKNNNEASSFNVIKGNEVLYNEQIVSGLIENIYTFENYLVVQTRLFGSGAFMSFDVFWVDENSVYEIYHSEDFSKGKLDFENDILKVSFPKLSQSEPLSEPLIEETKQYQLVDKSINQLENTEQKLEPRFSAQSGNYQNPSPAEISRLLTEVAIRNNIPPEILKSIAWAESTWRQYDSNGNPLIGYDGIGIGIMQVSDYRFMQDGPKKDAYVKRLKEDIEFNIEEGVMILLSKWNQVNDSGIYAIPKINDGSMDKIEHWYFAILAYSGKSKKNDPRFYDNTYQDKIYNFMNGVNGQLNIRKIPESDLVIKYNVETPTLMDFTDKLQYHMSEPLTETKHLFKNGQVLPITANLNLRDAPDGNYITTLTKGDPVLIQGEKRYSTSKSNHFVWYPVKTKNGETGYVASSYLDKRITFLDYYSTDLRGYEEVAMLAGQGIINGYSDGTFRPKDTLTRLQAALMFVRALDLPTPDVSETGFSDIKVGDNFYREIAAAKEAGIFRGVGGKFNKSDKLTRSEMAAVLVRAYELKGSSDKKFTDVPEGHQFESAIQTLYANGITKGINSTEFGFRHEITRVDFSVLLYKTMEKAR